MVLNLLESLEELGENVKNFLMNSEHNPIWIVLFVLGVVVFLLTYNALHKNN